MSGKRVAIITPDGAFGTIDEQYVDEVVRAGGRALTKQEATQRAVDERYDAQPALVKAAGLIGSGASLPSKIIESAFGLPSSAPPVLDAFAAGGRQGVSVGLADGLTRQALDATAGKAAGDRYAAETQQQQEASPLAHGAGEMVGMGAGLLAAPGAAAEGLAARGLARAGVTGASALGRAGAAAARFGARGAVEGALIQGGETAGDALLSDHELASDKLFSALGTGALYGGVGGAVLGGAGSLAMSGIRSGASRALGRSVEVIPEVAAASPEYVPYLTADALDAGIGAAQRAEKPFAVGGEFASVKPGGRVGRVPTEGAIDITGRMRIDPDAGIYAPEGKVETPIFESGARGPVGSDLGGVEIGRGPFKLTPPAADSIERFAEVVTQVGHDTPERFGRYKPFISDISKGVRAQFPGMSEAEFRAKLVEAHVGGHLQLARADLVPAMSKAKVAASETPYMNATFHFLDLEGTGAARAAAPRGSITFNPDAGLRAPRGKSGTSATPLSDILAEKPMRLAGDVYKASPIKAGPRPIRQGFDVGINAESGIARKGADGKFQGKIPTEDAVIPANRKGVRRVDFDPSEGGAAGELPSPIRLAEVREAAATPGAALTIKDHLNNMAGVQAWKAVAAGFGLQSTRHAKSAAKYFGGADGPANLGKIAIKYGAIDTGDAAGSSLAAGVAGGKSGTPAAIAPKLHAALDGVGERLGAITEQSGARIHVDDIDKVFGRVRAEPNRLAGYEHVVNAIDSYRDSLRSKLRTAPDGTVSVQDLLSQRKGLDGLVYKETKTLDPGRRVEALRDIRAGVEDLVTDALDGASGKIPGELRAEYKALKRDYHGLSILSEAAEDSAARASKHATFSATAVAMGAAGIAAGHGASAPLLAIATKIAKERGNAAAAAFLTREAERGNLARLVTKQDGLIDRASKGLITLPEKGAAKGSEVMPPPKGLATKALARVAAFQADPQSFLDHATRETEPIEAHSPEIATGIIQRQVRAMTFLSSKVPPGNEPDPLDPHKPLNMTPSQEAELARYAWYTEKPERFFAEVARGKLTPEGAEVAQELTPRAFAQLQATTAEALATQLARGNRLPFRQRELLGQLLDFAATPAQRPEHRAFLQQSVADLLPSNQRIATAGPTGPRRISSQNGSALDRLEAGGPGRRR